MNGHPKHNDILKKEWLYKEYIEKKKSTVTIARELTAGGHNVSGPTVINYLRKHFIPIRKSVVGTKIELDRRWLFEEYIINKKSGRTISKELKKKGINASAQTVIAKLKLYNIPIRKTGAQEKEIHCQNMTEKDRKLYESFFANYYKAVLGNIRRYIYNYDDANDVTQELFVKILRLWNENYFNHNEKKLKRFILRAAKQAALQFLRKGDKRKNILIYDHELYPKGGQASLLHGAGSRMVRLNGNGHRN